MENASKALLIAGGILLAMLVTGLLILLSNNMSTIGQAQEDKLAAEQLAAFNQQYAAYNKKLLYGTEVITVMNKAIQDNKNSNRDITGIFIDVEINVVQGYATTIVETTMGLNGEIKEKITTRGDDWKKDTTYNLLKDDSGHMYQSVIDFFNQPVTNPEPESKETPTGRVVKYTYNALTDFKRSIFKCEGIHYTKGRIDKITFTQIKLAEY